MNRNHLKALLPLALLGSLAGVADAQANPLPFPGTWFGPINELPQPNQDWVYFCWNPKITMDPYSTAYAVEYEYDSLFGAIGGVSGTVTFDTCFPTVVTNNVQGRLGFYVGMDTNPTIGDGVTNPWYLTGGSIQDNAVLTNGVLTENGTPIDDGLGLTWGDYSGVSGNFSIAKFFVAAATAPPTPPTGGQYFGQNAITTAYWGQSDRYFVLESTVTDASVQLRCDIIGDAARCQWTVLNTTAAAAVADLWFGQWVYMYAPGSIGVYPADYITAPGVKPMNVDSVFVLNAATTTPTAQGAVPPALEMPAYLDYGMSQSMAYGLQIVLKASTQVPDQTPVEEIDIGKNGFLLGSMSAQDGAMPDVLLQDTTMLNGADAYVEKFAPLTLGALGSTTQSSEIVAYYRSTWSTSDYAKPYSVVLDAPQVVSTASGNPNSFQNSPFVLAVDVDDTRGFSTNDQSVPLEDVEVDLDLPAGMSDANNPGSTHMQQFISIVEPQTVARVLFQVAVDPTLFGTQNYTVTVIPNPGTTKTVTSSIVVASQPYLQLPSAANLVTAPWQFTSSDWATIIGTNTPSNFTRPLVLDQDYQVFGWDATSQSYVLQTDPQRGLGSFVVLSPALSAANIGFVQLGGSPQQEPDLGTGAPQIILQPGWNLIANPYNYAIPLGQLVGVPEADNQNSYTFTELANNNYINGALAYWDPVNESYDYTQSFSDLIQPNTGYWLYVESDEPVTILYPPVFQAFLPGIADPYLNGEYSKVVKGSSSAVVTSTPIWSLQLAARSNGKVDASTNIGQAATAQAVTSLTRFKPPVAPVKGAISSSISVTSGNKTKLYGQVMGLSSNTTQTWNWQVFTQSAGEVTLTWPNLSSLPNNVQVKLVDMADGEQKELKTTPSYSFLGGANSTHSFELVVTTTPALPVIETLTSTSGPASANFSYLLSVNATTTVTVTQNGTTIATLVKNRADEAGTCTASWNYLDSANRLVRPGVYQVTVTSTPSGGSAMSKTVSFSAVK